MEENKKRNILSKVVIVTGGSRGIGAEIVKELAKGNYQVVLNYNKSEQQAKKIQQELLQAGKKIEIFKADVSKREEVKKLIEYTTKTYKRIDVLINNAGIAQEKLFTQITDEDWNNMLQTNLNSVFYGSQEVLASMLQQKQGCIINISSIVGVIGNAGQVNYSASKAGIIGMTKSIAREVASRGITCNAIAPGFIETDMTAILKEDVVKQMTAQIPMKKLGQVEDIAQTAVFLAKSQYITGQVIHVNGGMAM